MGTGKFQTSWEILRWPACTSTQALQWSLLHFGNACLLCEMYCQVSSESILFFFFFFSLFFFFNSGVKNHGWGIEWLCKIVWVLFKSYGHIWPWYRTLTDYVDRPINSWLTRQIELLWIHSSSISMGKLTQIFCIRIVKYCRRKKKKKSALPPTKNMKKNLCLTSRSFVSFHLQN